MINRILLFTIISIFFLISCSKENPTSTTNPPPNNSTTVTIGSQVWMTKNLDVDHYRNGDQIPQVTDATLWALQTTGAWSYYNNDPANGAIYGKLYNWFAVNDQRGLAPTGWHVPTDTEWTTLIDYLGSVLVAGARLKEAGTSHWANPNVGATNSSGFTALPAGGRTFTGSFNYIGLNALWWSATEYDTKLAWDRDIHNNLESIDRHSNYVKQNGFSVRCVQD